MQPTSSGEGDHSRGLARFSSAPTTWLEALLESEEEVIDPQIPPLHPTTTQSALSKILQPGVATANSGHADSGVFNTGRMDSGVGIFRHNSSPADFLSQICSGTIECFSNFESPPSFSSPVDASLAGKRRREVDLESSSANFSSQLNGGQGGQLHGKVDGMPDFELVKNLDDSVPCRVRAKRGCATDPRSIAERVRRTRISDRIRKLQELVPNIDKQTNTADMLDKAVEYVMYLQRQIQELKEHGKKCKCSWKE